GTVTSRTDHFTDFVNAVLTQPDVPQGTNLAPSSIRGIDNADPAAGIVLIEPPQAGPNGDAELELPLVLPPGRHGIEPHLAVHYSSQRTNGWLGLGWSLPVPSVTVDTAFGVPRYDPQLETETYLLDGAYLAPTANLVTPVPRRPDRLFTRRVEGSFERIVRKGSSPDAYWWEVTDQDGTRYVYGQSDQARLRDYQEPRNVFRWMLERIVDVHGNSADFTYFTDGGNDGESWVQIYPESIAYTAGEGQAPYYRVDFVRDTGDRPDAFSSGLPGFKTLTRYRLDHVDVRAGGALVRRYGFEYRDGDFSKSLLAAIAVSGEDPAAELYRHGFEYEQAERGAGGEVLAFADEVTWGGLSSSDDATHSTSVGAAVHAFVGLGPPGCFPHVGLQVGGGGGASLTSRLFLDVNGDGLPDRLNDDGGAELNRDGSFQPVDFPGASDLGRTIEFEFDLGVGAHAPPVNADASWVWSHANDDRTVADVDGDGRPDLVSTGGHFEVRRNLDGERFGSVERWEGFTFEGIDLTVPEEDDEVLGNFALSDSLRELVLPYAGTVTLTGTIQKQAAGGIDGVDVWIYKNDDDTPLWTRRFAEGDLSPCQPAPNDGCGSGLTFDVAAGDHLFFLTGSIEDTTADALLWQPRVAYQGMPVAATEPYGAPVSVFDGGDDFRLAGPPAAHWVAVAEGEVNLLGAITKQPTADDVAVVVSRFAAPDPEGNPPLTGEVLFRRDFAAADSVTFDDFPSFAVGEAESLLLQLVSDNQVDPERVAWTPQVTYGGGTLCLQEGEDGPVVCGPVECTEDGSGQLSCTWMGGPAPLPAEVLQAPAQPEIAVHHLEPANRPTVSWTAPSAGTFDFDISWKGPMTTAAGQVLVYTQQLHELLDKRPVPAGAEELDFTLSLPLAAGEVVWFTSLADDQAAAGTLTVTLPQGEEEPTPVAANTRWLSDAGSVLSGGYHGWYFGEWNGDVDFSYPWDEDTDDLVAAVPQWQGLEDLPQPVWRAAGFDLHLAKQGDKPSRRGGNVVVELGVAAHGDGSGPRMVHKTFGRTAGAGVDAVVGISLSTGTNVTQIDFVDVNGDRYPDQVAEGKVRYSNGTDGFGPLFDVPGFDDEPRRTEDGNLNQSIGLSLGIPYSKKGGKGKAKQTVNTMATAGRTRSLSQPRRDLRDVNGDGLPDLVSMVPNSREMKVRLNLGYRFGGEESWPLPAWTTRQLCDDFLPVPPNLLPPLAELNTPDALGLVNSTTDNAGIAIGPIGGGPSFTLSRNVVELADINGDGLADHLFRDQKGDFFRVKLNNGTGWDDETLWHEPDWQTALGGLPYDPLGLFQCLDAVSYNGVIGGSGSVAVPFCVPLVPPIVVAGLQIEVSVQAHGGTGGLQLFFEDVDGDGLPDHALKKTGQGSLHLKRNLTARVNLLRRVARPLGGSFTLDYARQGNRVDYSDPERLV
ncbi:MAG TPA: SpvB/TcaC N-terminal domain-containing protein, partial [Thermoanaerobaculia bacterium]|nr:SpvB/TcaC N-terminal domain-containing protein [Thermoanaerobaculia bacterium]